LIGLLLVLLTISIAICVYSRSEVGKLRIALARAGSSQETANRWRETSEKKLGTRDKELKDLSTKLAAAETKASRIEAELKESQTSKAELESKLEATESQLVDLRKQVAAAAVSETADPKEKVPGSKLAAELEETKRRMGGVEQENATLVKKLKVAQDRIASMDDEKGRRRSHDKTPGIHGTVMAVNQAYNFVVLSLGERQGVVPNSEMFVMRQGAFIGKIRISSVEPTTSIGDIITNSLARGVQVQPGDTVIYAGNASS
jgi:septal ring factor EnvC (AmiA/AmiB activator)